MLKCFVRGDASIVPIKRIVIYLFIVVNLLIAGILQAQNSVLSSGKWFKLSVSRDGIYKIDRKLFKKMGFDPEKVDPRKIKIFGNTGGMLPQANNVHRPIDLIENAIHVQGESDGVFSSDDFILFYAQGPDRSYFNEAKGIFFYEKNLYSDRNYYFITIADTNGKRIEVKNQIAGTFPAVTQFENFSYYELNQHSELNSGRVWYGERFDLTVDFSKTVNLDHVVPGSTIKLVSDVMAQSFSGSSFNVFLNGIQVLQQDIAAVPNGQYAVRGNDRGDTVTINANTVSASEKASQEIRYHYVKSPSGKSVGFLDNFLLQVTQRLELTGQQLSFRSVASLNNPISQLQLSQTSEQTSIWNVTNPYEPVLQTSTFSQSTTSFSTQTNTLQEFVAFLPNAPSPELVGQVPNQNLRGSNIPNLIIVSHPDFRNEAQRLAEHRINQGMTVTVVTTEEVYNEFSGGKQDVTAIRDFAKHLFDKSSNVLKTMLLFGKSSYDYKNLKDKNSGHVPTYQSRNSLDPLRTYASDDFYGFMENSEGDWGEAPAINHSLDIAIGRIPARNLTEATSAVDKLIRYDSDKNLLGNWRRKIAFIGDDGNVTDGYDRRHQTDANLIAQFIETSSPAFEVEKIYFGLYEKTSTPSGDRIPEVNEKILRKFNEGALILNYTGHGGERLLADEKVYDDLAIAKLKNHFFPLLITATCEFGRHDDPALQSGAELGLLKANGGTIGSVTSSRPVNSGTNFIINNSFYEAFVSYPDQTIGEIFRVTKNTSLSGVSNRNYIFLGDPSMRLAIPSLEIKISKVSTTDNSDTLKALSQVILEGSIVNQDGGIENQFNGQLVVTLFDKRTEFITTGKNNPQVPFAQWYNALFRGSSSITDGKFFMSFQIPKNIEYTVGEGRLSLYSSDENKDKEASGYFQGFKIGLSESTTFYDLLPPSIELFLGDTTFVNGGITSPNTTLIARLTDNNGINISGYGIGNSIEAELDNATVFILNDYYTGSLDKSNNGMINFPLNNLEPGNHTIVVRAWDVYNNPTRASIDFVVSKEGLLIEAFGNYPNPFRESTTLFFRHNHSTDVIEAKLILYNTVGTEIYNRSFLINQSNYHINLFEMSDKHLPAGIYIAKLLIKSLTDATSAQAVTRMVVIAD